MRPLRTVLRTRVAAAFAHLVLFALPLAASALEVDIVRPRLAAGDVDGDGLGELIVAGRVGPFVAVTDPDAAGRAAVAVFRAEGVWLRPVARTDALTAAGDVAVGDADGDGRAEIYVASRDRLLQLRLVGGVLSETAAWPVSGGELTRIELVDVDADGRDEVVLAAYAAPVQGDAGRTTVSLARISGDALVVEGRVLLEGHVGDLARLVDRATGKPWILAEVGWGDEGGGASLLTFDPAPRPVWQKRAGGAARALTVAGGLPGTAVFLRADGTEARFGVTETGLRLLAKETFRGGSPSALRVADGRWVRARTVAGGSVIDLAR